MKVEYTDAVYTSMNELRAEFPNKFIFGLSVATTSLPVPIESIPSGVVGNSLPLEAKLTTIVGLTPHFVADTLEDLMCESFTVKKMCENIFPKHSFVILDLTVGAERVVEYQEYKS